MADSKVSKGSKGSKTPSMGYVITGAARPSAGSALASYTAAWLMLSGMATGSKIPAAVVRKVAGDTAFAYHVKQGNFSRTDEGVTLTEKGELHFIGRTKIQPDPEMVRAYESVMTTGKPDGTMVKNPEFVQPIKG